MVRRTEATRATRVLFLCTGNYYRSRFAEIYFNELSRLYRVSSIATSAGLSPHIHELGNEGAVSPYTIEALRHAGLGDISVASNSLSRPPRRVTEDDWHWADTVIGLSRQEHRPMVEAQFPQWADGVRYWTVEDVDLQEPDAALAEIGLLVDELVRQMSNSQV